MDDPAIQENKACQAVVQEMRAWFAQNGAPEVALKLLDECAGRIELRRILARIQPGAKNP